MKTCTKCSEKLPATLEYFSPDKRNKDGLQGRCQNCCNNIRRIWREENPERHRKYQEKQQREYVKTFYGYVAYLVAHIKYRCTNRNYPDYKYYGGRGIRCLFTTQKLIKWLTVKDIDPRGLCIHRIDNDGNYSLNNIIFLERSRHTTLHHVERRKTERVK